MRHVYRWQDVEELLAAGVDVYTTLNVQHLESLNAIVAQITNMTVRDTVPDRILETADEAELIDLSLKNCCSGCKDGKFDLPGQPAHVSRNFFP